MDEQNIPIDINTNKLLDWLLSRRHIPKDWPSHVLKVREKINNAIQDMPAHDGIIRLLSGQHINYFHCLAIVDILKETEADSKNLFGRYGSQRMKDWQDIIACYQRDNAYLAEVAQMLARNVSYEIPSVRRQIAKLEQSQLECEKKIKECTKTEGVARKEFNVACEQLGIAGENIRMELLDLLKELPKIHDSIGETVRIVKPAMELYGEFNKFLSHRSTGATDNLEILTALKYLIDKGNTTTYEYIYGEKPLTIELKETQPLDPADLGDIDFGGDASTIDFGDAGIVDYGDATVDIADELNIDFGDSSTTNGGDSHSSTNNGDSITDDFEIVTLEESGIVVEVPSGDSGVARGIEALTILDNPATRDQIIYDLIELDTFLKMRLYEMSGDGGDLLSMSQMQNASSILQMQTIESVTSLSDCVSVALSDVTNKRLQHLHNLKDSPKYVDILTGSLKQKLSVIEKLKQQKVLLEKRIEELRGEVRRLEPVAKLLVNKTKELQKEIQIDISRKYKGRIVNIVGGVNMI